MVFIQLAVLLICIFIGARMSGIGLGVMGMIGLLILLFVFGMQPSDPPLEVMLIILSVVTAAAALQAAGGMDYLVDVAGKILRKHPGQITFLGPLVTYAFVLFAGTAHISYSIMPIIAEVAIKNRIRPERAMSMSVTAAHMAITASPVSAAAAALLSVIGATGMGLAQILIVAIPSTLIGVLIGILFVWKRGKELKDDPEFQERMKDPAFAKNLEGTDGQAATTLAPGAIKSVIIFAVAIVGCCAAGIFPRSVATIFRKTRFYARVCCECIGPCSNAVDDHDDYAGRCWIDYPVRQYNRCKGHKSKFVCLGRSGHYCCIWGGVDE